MNREIKFRIYNKNTGKFIPPEMLAVSISNDNTINFINLQNDFGDLVSQQYTGCKDGGNKEIYEGDIIEYTAYDTPIQGYVSFFAGGFYVNWNDQTDTSLAEMLIHKMKIVGNIFENKELLK